MTDDELFNNYYLARLLAEKDVLDDLRAKAIEELLSELEAMQRDLRRKLLTDSEGLAEIKEWTQDRLERTNEWLDSLLIAALLSIIATIRNSILSAVTIAMTAANNAISFDAKARAVRTVDVARVQESPWLNETVGGDLDQFVSNGVDDGVKVAVLETLSKGGEDGGMTPEAMRQALSDAIDEGGMTTRQRITTLAATSILTAEAKAHMAVYEANRKLIAGYRRLEMLDKRTCLQCALMSGAYYPISEGLPFPGKAHPNCRGEWVPVFKNWEEMGFADAEEFRETARSWVKGNASGLDNAMLDYKSWWEGLPEEEKANSAIGPRRRKLLETGAVKWDELWDRRTGKVVTLAKLGFDRLFNPRPHKERIG